MATAKDWKYLEKCPECGKKKAIVSRQDRIVGKKTVKFITHQCLDCKFKETKEDKQKEKT